MIMTHLTTKKRGYDPQKHYMKTEADQFHNSDDNNKVLDEFTELEVEDRYQRKLAKRRKTREEVDKTVKHAINMLDLFYNKSGIEKNSDDYSKLKATLEWSVKTLKRTEANCN
jgi:hypothetical protein